MRSALYSIIHLPRPPAVFAEFHRLLAPGGHMLLAFQRAYGPAGDEPCVITDWFGHSVCLDYYRHHPDRITELLQQTDFTLQTQLVREPDGVVKKVARAYLLAQRGD
jgi:SAM-dependent methyltransferase